MPKIVVMGAGVVGLTTAMMLADDGHDVVVIERDATEPATDPEAAWHEWERRGVNQFRMLHYFAPRYRSIVDSQLPRLVGALDAAGALRMNIISAVPDEITGGFRTGEDEQFEALTARRPVFESVLANAAAATPRLEIRRGVAVKGLATGTPTARGVPHVTGVVTESGEEITADVIVDATGRRSPVGKFVDALGERSYVEDQEDLGFRYFGRHFASSDGSLPPMMGPLLTPAGSISILTLPSDNGTWGIGIITSAGDDALRGLRDEECWNEVVRSFPLHAHWLDGKPLDDEVQLLTKLEDRVRTFVVDDQPVVTGVLPVGDAWACTNPSLGRGASIGALHGVALRDHLHDDDLDDPIASAVAWQRTTDAVARPYYDATQRFDRSRLAEMQAAIDGTSFEGDAQWDFLGTLGAAATQDPDLFRELIGIVGVLKSEDEVARDERVVERAQKLGAGWRDEPSLGPSRDELLAIAAR
jgi:2-polyprenyl-6-methoxyphenol hydroxylase-like FAD-dependent oxidoreductase